MSRTKESIFTLLGTYKSSEDVSAEENYSTELLVYLLKYSIENATDLFSIFMKKMLGENISVHDYKECRIFTQQMFYTSNNSKALPDITMEIRNKLFFIEVKVEAGLNYYLLEMEKKPAIIINQIQKYQDIKIDSSKSMSIYLLTKYPRDIKIDNCPDFIGRFKWSDIHKLFNSYQSKDIIERYLLTEIIKYMEDKDMSVPKVSYEIVKGMESLINLFRQIETALEDIPHQKSFASEWMGYYIVDKKGWVGNYYEGSKLSFEHRHQKVMKHIEEAKLKNYGLSDNKEHYYTYFDFDENHYFCLSAEGQLDALRKWIKYNYDLIVKYS